MRFSSIVAIAGAILLGSTAAPARAVGTTFFVDSTTDDTDKDWNDGLCATSTGVCTLRAAVQQANHIGGVTIQIPPGNFTVDMGSLAIETAMTITGAGMYETVLSSHGSSRIFRIGDVPGVLLSDMALVDGYTVSVGGGAISFEAHDVTLTIRRCLFTNNRALVGGAVYVAGPGARLNMTGCVITDCHATSGTGGALWVGGGGTVSNTTIHGNTASTWAGGIHAFGDVLKLVNCTISGNTSYAGGGGGLEVGPAGQARLYNTTVALNTSFDAYGGGIANEGDAAKLTFVNSIVAYNGHVYNNTYIADDCAGSMTSLGNSIVPDTTSACGITGAYSSADPVLGPLQLNGGDRPTHAILAGSPAIDGGPAGGCVDLLGASLKTDARGVARPIGGTCDIGAYERTPCGDANGDGVVNTGDALFLINHLFAGGPKPPGPGNVNGDGTINVSDVLHLINNLFAGGPAPSCPGT